MRYVGLDEKGDGEGGDDDQACRHEDCVEEEVGLADRGWRDWKLHGRRLLLLGMRGRAVEGDLVHLFFEGSCLEAWDKALYIL